MVSGCNLFSRALKLVYDICLLLEFSNIKCQQNSFHQNPLHIAPAGKTHSIAFPRGNRSYNNLAKGSLWASCLVEDSQGVWYDIFCLFRYKKNDKLKGPMNDKNCLYQNVHTPPKTNMEPENTTLEKEKHLQKNNFWGSMLIFQGVCHQFSILKYGS